MKWQDRLKKIKWKQKLRQGLEILSDASEVVVHLRDKPKIQDYLAITSKVVNSAFSHIDKLRSRPFKGWSLVDLWEYKDFLYDITKRNFDLEVIYDTEEQKAIIVEINGIKFGWLDHGSDSHVSGPYVEKHIPREDWMQAIGKMIWDDLGSSACEIAKRKGVIEDDYSGGITVFKVDRQDNVHESKIAHDIIDRSKAFLDKGYNRSIMLYGIPGTGKSSAMRFVAKEFGKYSLRINVGDLDFLSSEDMILAIELLKPSTLMIDDFDRAINPSKFLTELEEFNNHVQLLMVSVNHIENLDDAVIRPGRFDDIVEVNMLDEAIVNKFIGDGIPDAIKNRLRRLPIAYVVEFHKRREVLGLERALGEVVDLEKRIRSAQMKLSNPEPERTRKKRRKRRKKFVEEPVFKGKQIKVDLLVGEEEDE